MAIKPDISQTAFEWDSVPRRFNVKRSKKRLNEAITVDLVRKKLRENGYEDDDTIVVEREQSTHSDRVNKLLLSASKRGSDKGYPDFIITSKHAPNFVCIAECKSDITKHQSATLDNYTGYAVDGARLYADYLSREMDVLYLGISGQTEKELKVSHYLRLKGDAEHREIFKGCGIQDFPSYLEQLKNHRFRVDYANLLKYVGGLNQQLHSKKIPERDRAILFSGILLALEDDIFRNAYKGYTQSDRLAQFLIESVSSKLISSNVPQHRLKGLKAAFTNIQHHPGLIEGGYLSELISEIDNRIRTFVKSNEYHDIISRCYVEFLKYANDDGSLGIVLTPSHITELFCDLGSITQDSVILDNCCGTGGFLVAAMGKMVHATNGDKQKIENIKAQQIVGIEFQNHIFNLAVSNMIIHGDGKSNIFNGDCFSLIDKVKPFKPDTALLNPPFNDGSELDELLFIENALDALSKNGIAIAIAPMRCALYQSGEGLEIKRRILKSHTIDAVMSLPDELFYPKGVITCALIFRAHIPHDSSKCFKTWFGYWKDDGHLKVKHRGRIDVKGLWESIKQRWVSAYANREIVPGESVARTVTAEDEWCAEAYMETDYSKITKSDFEMVVRNYAIFKLTSNDRS